MDARLHDRLGSSGEGVSGGGDGVGLGSEEPHARTIGTLDDESMTSARLGHPDVVELDLEQVAAPAVLGDEAEVDRRAGERIERDRAGPPRAVDVDRLPGDLEPRRPGCRRPARRSRAGCRPMSSGAVGEDVARRSGAGRRPAGRSIAVRSDRSSAHRGRWTRPRRPQPRRSRTPWRPIGPFRAASGRRSLSTPGSPGRSARWPAPCRCHRGCRVQPRETSRSSSKAPQRAIAHRRPEDGQRTGGALHQVQHRLLVPPGLGRDHRVVGVVLDRHLEGVGKDAVDAVLVVARRPGADVQVARLLGLVAVGRRPCACR